MAATRFDQGRFPAQVTGDEHHFPGGDLEADVPQRPHGRPDSVGEAGSGDHHSKERRQIPGRRRGADRRSFADADEAYRFGALAGDGGDTPPLAVPSSLVTTRPVIATALSKP